VEPAKYFVLVTKREKRACRSCEDLGVVSAPLPPRTIEKCLASDRIVIETVVSKYCNHTPLHRQSMILERDLGLEISRATLDGWVLKVGELLIPIDGCINNVTIYRKKIGRSDCTIQPRSFLGDVRMPLMERMISSISSFT
jgi:transposase